MMRRSALVLFGFTAACRSEGPPVTSTLGAGPGSTSVMSSSSGTSAGHITGGTSSNAEGTSTTASTTPTDVSTGSSSASTSSSPKHDVGSDGDAGSNTPLGCQGKIDFLFVMSRSGLLDDVQEQFVASLPLFIDTIAAKFADFDYHIMVVDGSDTWGSVLCNGACPDVLTCKVGDPCCLATNPVGKLCCATPNYPCDQLDLVTECDNTIGAGLIFPAGYLASNKLCKLESGKRYITKGQSNLSETFTCTARAGLAGGSKVAEALVNAVGPELNAPGGCNDGFLRDDALLMVTMLTTGSDYDSPGTPKEWYEAIVAAKGGDPKAIVMLLLANPLCPDFDRPCKMAEMLPYWHVVDIEAEDYSPGFDAATDLVEAACEELIPQ